jgi:hypothetical protein
MRQNPSDNSRPLYARACFNLRHANSIAAIAVGDLEIGFNIAKSWICPSHLKIATGTPACCSWYPNYSPPAVKMIVGGNFFNSSVVDISSFSVTGGRKFLRLQS